MTTVKKNRITVQPMLLFLICNPFIEILYAMLGIDSNGLLNINRLLRFAALFIMLVGIKSKRSLKHLFCIGTVFVISYVGVIASNVQISVGTDVGYLLKIYMGFTAYYYFCEKITMGQMTEDDILKSLLYASVIVSGGIIFSLFGLGFQTYSGNRFGFRGLFAAANVPTAYLLMTLPIALMYIKTDKKFSIIAVIMSCLALPLLGTKTGIFGTLLMFFFIAFNSIHKTIKKTTALFLLVGFAVGIGALSFVVYRYIPYLRNLFLSNSYYHNSVYSFILSNRDTQVFLAEQYFNNLPGSKKILAFLFGVGYSRIENVLSSTYSNYFAVEMDFHAIYFYCGALVLAMVLYRIIYALKSGFVNWRNTKSQEDFYLLLAISIAAMHAWLGGHTLTDSMCIFPAYIIMAIISVRRAKLKKA